MSTIAVHLGYASLCLAENVTFVFGEKVYQVDRHIILLAKGLFQHFQPQFVPFPSGSLKFVYLAKSQNLTDDTLNCVLSFFQKGEFVEKPTEEMQGILKRVAKTYQLSLLKLHLKTLRGECASEQIPLVDQLKMSALRQQPQQFYEILCQMRENSSGQWNQEEICQAVAYFRPQAFAAFMVDYVKEQSVYDVLLEAYVKEKYFCLENAFHLFRDQKLRLDCLAHFPLDRRLVWCQALAQNVSHDFLQKKVLSPLIEAERLGEAKKWVQKTKNSDLALFLIEIFMQKGLGQEADDLFPLVPEGRRESIARKYIMTTLETFCLKEKPALKDPIEAIKTTIMLYFRFYEQIQKYSSTKITLMGHVASQLEDTFYPTRTPALSTVLELSLQYQINNLQRNVTRDLKRAKPAVQPYELYFHPAFQEDLILLQGLAYTLEADMVREFGSSEESELVKDLPLKGRDLFEEILLQVRHLYCQHCSLEEDFIIQFVSTHIQPFIFLQRSEEWKPLINEQPFMEKLQEAFKEVGFGDRLSSAQWDVALYAYIRKCVEAANFKLYYPENERIDIYSEEYQSHIKCKIDLKTMKSIQVLETILSSEQQEVSDLVEGLATALKRDFPLDRLTDLSAKNKQLLLDSTYLKQEVLVKLLQASYRIHSPPPVEYERYIPDTLPSTPINTPASTPIIRRAEITPVQETTSPPQEAPSVYEASPQNDESPIFPEQWNGASSEPPITPPKPRRKRSIRIKNHSTRLS